MSQILIPKDNQDNNNFNFKELIEADEKFDLGTSFEKIEDHEIKDDVNIEVSNFEKYDKPKEFKAGTSSTVNLTSRKYGFGNQSNSPNESYAEHRVSGPKHKVFLNNLNNSVQNFISDYREEIFNQIIKKYNDEINELVEEKYSKKFVVFKNYHSQIAEMEVMMKDDDGHKESIQSIIDSLEDDKEKEIEKIENEFQNLISEKQKDLKEFILQKNQSVGLIEEKFKVEMLGILNEIIYSNTQVKK